MNTLLRLMKLIFIFLAIALAITLPIKKKDMTWRQNILKALYPVIMLKGKIFGNQKDIKLNVNQSAPTESFYNLSAIKNNGDTLAFSSLKGKKVLIVNTASDCGFTGQYEELEKLHQQFGDRLIVLGFPANDFKEQEKKSDTAIAEFCKINYGVSFQLMQKSHVIKGPEQHPVFKWLSNASANGWSNHQPVWNFSKYIIDENGALQAFYTQMVSPLDQSIKSQILK